MIKPNGVIALCGSKGSGKSTAASIFTEVYPHPIQILAIAEKLKITSSRIFTLDPNYFENQELKERELDTYRILTRDKVEEFYTSFGISPQTLSETQIRRHMGRIFDTPRKILQYVGSELLTSVDKTVHIKNLCQLKSPDKLTVISDLRFKHELQYLRDLFGNKFVPLYIQNTSAEYIAKKDAHLSEQELFSFTHECLRVDNNGSMGEFINRIRDIAQQVSNEKL